MLDADEVLAGGRVGGDLERRGVLVPGAPVGVFEALLRDVVAEAFLVHFEPVAGAVVLLDVAGGFGHVDLEGAGVFHCGACVVSFVFMLYI